jgi:RNA polymerase sigma-70 factor (ECF subfamily)
MCGEPPQTAAQRARRFFDLFLAGFGRFSAAAPSWGKGFGLADAQTLLGIYQRFVAPVRLKCRRILGQTEEAEEVTHDAFLRLLQEGPRWIEDRDTPVVMAWLYKTSTRLCIDRIRRRKEVGAPDTDDSSASLRCHSSMEQALGARRLLAQVTTSASADALAVVVLCRIDGLTQPEAAAILTISERTVRRLLDQFDDDTAHLRRELTS